MKGLIWGRMLDPGVCTGRGRGVLLVAVLGTEPPPWQRIRSHSPFGGRFRLFRSRNLQTTLPCKLSDARCPPPAGSAGSCSPFKAPCEFPVSCLPKVGTSCPGVPRALFLLWRSVGGCGRARNMSAPGACGPGSACNPRKFSEKIALQRQRQAEDTAAFEEVMMDIGSTRLQVQNLRMNHMRGPYYGGSLPNVNQIGSSTADFQSSPQSPLDPSRSTRHHGLVERVHRDPRRMMSPLRRYMRQIDSSPYGGSYLSPHKDPGIRRNLPWGGYPSDTGQMFRLPTALNRTNSDSALHTSLMNPSSQDPYHVPSQVVHPGSRSAFPFPVPAIEENLLKPCDTKKLSAASARPKSCEVPGINIYPSMDQTGSMPTVPSILNTGGSLPDLTNLHSPLPTPLDPENSGFKSLSGGNSTGNLTNTMTHLDISRVSLPPAFDTSGFSSLSRPSLQSSLSNPNLQSSLSSTSLQSSFSNPSLQSSLSSQSLPSSLSNHSLSPSVSNHSLQSTYSTPSSPSSSSSFPPLAPTPMSTSPRRRVPLSPLTLPIGGDSRRPHQKQFSPTMSPTLSSITQGVPLDTSKLTGDQRLPFYHFSPPNVLQQPQHLTQQAMHQGQHPSQQPMHQAMHQTQHLAQQVMHQAQHPGQQAIHQSQNVTQFMHNPQHLPTPQTMHQPQNLNPQTILPFQHSEQQTVKQRSHMSQLGMLTPQPQEKQMLQQPQHSEQQTVQSSRHPSEQGEQQERHPSLQDARQGQHPSQQGGHQPQQHPSQQGGHQPQQHLSQQGGHQPQQHLSQQGGHQPQQHPFQQGGHQPQQHPSQQGGHQPQQHQSQQGDHQPQQHPSQQGGHQPQQHQSQQGGHQPQQHPSQQAGHQQHPSQQGGHQQHPSQQGGHQQHQSQQGGHQPQQHPFQQGGHQPQQHPFQQDGHPTQQGGHQPHQHPTQQDEHQPQQQRHFSSQCQSHEGPPPYQNTPKPSTAHYLPVCQQNSGSQLYHHLMGDYNLSTFDQCNMAENSNGHPSLSSATSLGEYHHVLIGDLSENNIYNSQPVSKQNLNHSSRHDPIPDIILTAVDSPPGFSKEITTALSCIPGFEVDQFLDLDSDLNIEPLGLDGLNMLTDPYALLTDPLVEDSFRSDRLQ